MQPRPAPYPLYTFSVPSLRVCKGFRQRCCVVLRECCVMCYVVCSSVSLLSLLCVFSLCRWWRRGSKILGGDKGAAPPRAQAPSPCRVGLAPQILQPLAEVVHRKQVAYNDNQLQEPSSILHRCVIAFLLLPECVKEIGDAEEWDRTEGEPHNNL